MFKKRKKSNTNALILQNQLKNLTLNEEKEIQKLNVEPTDLKLVEPVIKIKKKGIPKDELINTKRLLCS